ncbi:DoxX family protein [Seonamhaeicola maritimus]|uniref:DoxX family protein n=1 Tax=Seonamhaeicola maritimus TaxID=2591822 RepID=A0A5C7GEN6_9FLAO|nr:DoxX family protein [Seonamhaeicola maritimus]TXG35425.1 DoxX family protein [Seonamhaeicola maritimus]
MNKNLIDLALLILRFGSGGLMLTHGIPKISKLFESPIKFSNPIGLGETPSLILTLIGEVLAPIFMIIGFKTKIASVPAIITMFVAAFVIHLSDPIGKKEKAILYLMCFVVLFLTGAGKYSIDSFKKS